MRKVRRVAAVAAAAMAFVGLSSMVAAPATAAKPVKGPQIVNQLLRPVDSGEAEWVNVWLRTDRRVCDVKLWVRDNNRVDVSHPGGRPYTSLSRNDRLNRGERDYASFRVEADVDRSQWVLIGATLTYDYCGPFARTQFKHTGVVLPVRG